MAGQAVQHPLNTERQSGEQLDRRRTDAFATQRYVFVAPDDLSEGVQCSQVFAARVLEPAVRAWAAQQVRAVQRVKRRHRLSMVVHHVAKWIAERRRVDALPWADLAGVDREQQRRIRLSGDFEGVQGQ